MHPIMSDGPEPVDLDALRQRIDAIDTQILALVAERIQIVLQVGDYKRQRGMPVYDPERERALLDRLSSDPPTPLDGATVRRIFERLVDESRCLEQHHVKRTE
jgi:chorismate mutase